VSDNLVQSVDQKMSNFHVNFQKFHALFSMRLSQLGLSITSFAQDGFQKCSWVCINRREWLGFSFDSLEQYHEDDNEFLSHIVRVTADETWVSFVNVETKDQSKQWMHTYSLSRPKSSNICQKADGNRFL
jgi:hypothetical protein